MFVTSQVIRQSVVIYYDSVAISMHMPLLAIVLAMANMISSVSYWLRWVD